jgi:transcriptional regulator with XRE-family HTH domain
MERDFQLDWAEIVEEARRRRSEQKLTMRRLAAGANVSLPTVLRFEKNRQDIQLSSALAILGALGMVARKTEGTLLVRGAADGPYRVMFAPLAGAGGPLEAREIPGRAELESVLGGLGIDEAAQRLAMADLLKAGVASITGLQLGARQIRELWPEQYGRG